MVAVAYVTHFLPGIQYSEGVKILALISVVLALANIFVKPVIKIFTLPIELATLGLFSILINAGMLYLTAYLVPQFSIHGFYFTGLETEWVILVPHQIPLWGTAVIGSFCISMITSIIGWLID